MNTTLTQNLGIVSILLRLSIATLMLGAAVTKVQGGIGGTISYFQTTFADSLLPGFLVTFHASIIMILEFALGLWLLSGFKLKWAWIANALTLVTLAFGLIFVQQYASVSDNYIYVLIACIGLAVSSYDPWQLGKKVDS